MSFAMYRPRVAVVGAHGKADTAQLHQPRDTDHQVCYRETSPAGQVGIGVARCDGLRSGDPHQGGLGTISNDDQLDAVISRILTLEHTQPL